MSGTVLLLTHTGDFFTIDRVAAALQQLGARPFRLDTDRFPASLGLSHRSGSGASLVRRDGGDELVLEDVSAVWVRHIWQPSLDPALDPRFVEHSLRETYAAFTGLLDALHGASWIDRPVVASAAEDKARQLRLAKDAGLAIPRTLLSNDPVAVRAFAAEIAAPIVCKLLRPLSVSMGRSGAFVGTNLLRPEDLADLEGLRHCPMLFQERIEKERELRIVFVDGDVFCGSLFAPPGSKGGVDWRLAEPGELAWRKDSVPDDVAAGIGALMARLGLRFGALDVIREPGGRHVFLEVNPGGEWGMLERDLGLPISLAIARALLR